MIESFDPLKGEMLQILDEEGRVKSDLSRRLDLADLKGGTFSITNVGMIGGEAVSPSGSQRIVYRTSLILFFPSRMMTLGMKNSTSSSSSWTKETMISSSPRPALWAAAP